MAYSYFTVAHSPDERAIQVHDLPDRVEHYYRLTDAVPVGNLFPPATVLSVHPRSGDMLTDFIDNSDAVLEVSANAREVLMAQGMGEGNAEYLPFTLHDKQGRVVKEQYFVVNLLRSVACFDLEKSRYKTYPKNPDEIYGIRSVYLREDRIPLDARLFRLAESLRITIIRSDLVEAVEKAGLVGLAVLPLGADVS
ncbi:hypothetical protein OV208_32925 [Corallococcus sp. bb12-1]|uniref:imm11 family protein n=1 Tax=Corallococcus sp. bb12-1 TaxID=2996784 RepID=UPI00226F63CA|nr:DUF1629 domain-containing protein [Corallococcus sp. bb12-1]MCY1046161.1 hypothetical protein [Corallococcus sp. bb12-1]